MGRLRGFLWLIAGLVVAVLAGGVAFLAISRATAQEAETSTAAAPQEQVVVAARMVDVRDVLTVDDVELKEVPVELVPEGAIFELDAAIGKLSAAPLYPGEVVLGQRLLDPTLSTADGRMAILLAEDEVLFAFPAEDLINQLNVLKSGDRVDFLFTYALPVDRDTGFLPGRSQPENTQGDDEQGEATETVTFSLLQNVTIAEVVHQINEEGQQVGGPRGLLLALSPQEALVLKYMKDAGATVDLVLRAPDAEGRFSVEPVDLDYLINGYIQPGNTVP